MTALEQPILIVEDEPGWRAVYADLLAESAGYPCEYAASYGEARGLMQRFSFALAIVDLHLVSSVGREANRDGFALLRLMRQARLPAIVISALGAPEDIDRAYDEFGVFAFIEKEAFDRRAFTRTVAAAMQPATRQAAPPDTAGESAAGLAGLTVREREVLNLLTRGDTNRQIAAALNVTPNTIKKHVDHIFQKLGVSSRAGAVAAAVRAGVSPGQPDG